MRSLQTLKKNFKLLIRSKGSALVVLFAPLLIVLIIGVGFADTTPSVLNIGVHAMDNGELTQRYIGNLNTSENKINMFSDEPSCVDAIKEGLVVTCIIFPADFVISDEKQNEVTFYVDESRINLVYQLISSLTLNLGGESTQVSQELTSKLLGIMAESSTGVKDSIALIIGLKAAAKSSSDANTVSKTSLTNLNVEDEEVNFGDSSSLIVDVESDYKKLKEDAENLLKDGTNLLDDISSYNFSNQDSFRKNLEDLRKTLNTSNETSANLDALVESITSASASIDILKEKLDKTRNVKSSVLSNVNSLSENLQKINTDLETLKTKQEKINTDMSSFGLKTADSIVNPITTTIKPISTKNSKITYSFPYLLMLVVLFVGLMLSSTLVFIEKDSRAFFRNFTTPTKSSYFSFMTYITSVIILIIQSGVILALVYFALYVPSFVNIQMSVIFLILGMSVFILLGMLVGSVFSTSEAITMSTITIGSVLIFLSNLILPLETLSPTIQQIARFNPYVISAEGIRKSMLFEAGIQTLYVDMIILAGYAVALILITFIIKKAMASGYLTILKSRNNKNVISVPEDHFLIIENVPGTIKNISDLIATLKEMSDADYNKIVKKENIFSKWLKENLNAKTLSTKIKRKKRTQAIKILEKYIQKR